MKSIEQIIFAFQVGHMLDKRKRRYLISQTKVLTLFSCKQFFNSSFERRTSELSIQLAWPRFLKRPTLEIKP